MSKAAADLSESDMAELFRLLAAQLSAINTEHPQVEADGLRQSIELRIPAIVAANTEGTGKDEVYQKNLLFTSLVMASYQVLRHRTSDATKVISLLRTAFSDLFRPKIRAYIKQRFDVDAQTPETAFENIASNFLARGQSGFGAGFTYEQERQSNRESFINVTECSFLEFFRKNDVPELTLVICAMDAVWADELNNNPYNVSFERPTLMSQGADKCRFQFSRIASPEEKSE